MAPGRAYTLEEKREILRYIVQHNGFYTFRGVELWKNMERDFCQRRSWQSLREHFRKKLHPNLKDSSLGLTPAEIKKFPVYVGKPSGAAANGASGGRCVSPLLELMMKTMDSTDSEDEAA